MLLVAVDDPVAYRGLLRLLADIVNGNVNDEARQLLLAARLIPLSKREDPNGVRPIAVGEVLVRVAGKLAFDLVRNEVYALFESVQLGCGATGGAQTAATLIQLAARSDWPLLIILRDITNAFNEVSRVIIMERLYEQPQLWRIFRMSLWLLGAATPLFVVENGAVLFAIVSVTGVRQGCTLGPFLFAIAIHRELTEALAATRAAFSGQMDHVLVFAVLDNISVVGSARAVAFLGSQLTDLIRRRGDLRFKPREEKMIFMADGALPREATEFQQEHARIFRTAPGDGLHVIRRDSPPLRVLGSIVGGANDALAANAALALFNSDHDQLLGCLSNDALSHQEALLLLRLVVSGFATHMLRTMTPSTTARVAERVDDAVRAALETRFGVSPANGFAYDQCLLPISSGGLGLPHASATAPIAFIAGMAQAAPVALTCPPLLESGHFDEALAAAFDSEPMLLAAAAVGPSRAPRLPPAHDLASVCNYFRDPVAPRSQRRGQREAGVRKPAAQELQRDLSRASVAGFLQDALNPNHADPAARVAARRHFARLDACQGPCGSAVLTCCPTSQIFNTLADTTMRIHVRLRLGLIPIDNLPPSCCCPADVLLADAPSHLVSCPALMHRSGASTVRHTLVGQAMAAFLREAGISAAPEVRHLHPGTQERPDLLIHDAAGRRILTDHTVIDSISAGRMLADHPVTSERAIEIAEASKRNRYRRMVQQVGGAIFMPIVLCTLGRASRATIDLLYLRSVSADQVSLDNFGGPSKLIAAFVTAVACAIAKGNAHIATNTSALLRSHAEQHGILAILQPPPPGPAADLLDDVLG
jgi:hypothetical protein